jgi:hypothetical protein
MANISIGYYVHHHGSGHMQTALQIIPHIKQQVILLSSAQKPSNLPSNATFVQLENDAIESYRQPLGSAFMYTPHSSRLLHRFQQILEAVRDYNITCMYVDVSLEVALFCKILGLTVGHNVMLGIRTDDPHTNLYAMCDFYISDNAPQMDVTSKRHGPRDVEFIGGISRYKKTKYTSCDNYENVVITLSPKSESTISNAVLDTARAYPYINWHIVGAAVNIPKHPNIIVHGTVPDPKHIYMMADVAVGAGGHNTINEMASLGKRFICIPEDRPYQEQVAAAKALEINNMAVYCPRWPSIKDWQELFKNLNTIDLEAFQSVVNNDAAKRAAGIIAAHA